MKFKKHVREVDLLPPIALRNWVCPILGAFDWKEERGVLESMLRHW